jgi:hypothetical protein
MHGDIKGAWLSDTSTASVTGTELHPNGNWDFSSTNVSYISNTASGTATVVSGQLQLSGGTSNYSDHIISITTVVGKQYVITIDYVTAVAGQQIGMYHQNTNTYLIANDGQGISARSSGTKLNWYFTAVSTSTGLDLVTTGTTANIHVFDNWSIRLAETDRSVNNKGLQVFGTLTKSAVATGSNLVAYGGFSGSNYLSQPQNTALDFGTGNFSIMFWGIMVPLTGTYRAFQINHVAGPTDLFMDGIGLAITIGGNNKLYQNTSSNNIGWSHQTLVRISGVLQYYVNGRLIASTASTESLVTNSSSTLKIGEGFNQSLSLFRISTTAPSPEQIRKIYEDEKALFQPNSQCTLFGSSDAVTALAYDDTTKLLSVGTSSGRSDFQGLERINNTTTAVTTAISASNGLIAEQ